ncbi:MAG: hypothetical protein IAF58_09770 [Leptolyngbya sp.]|nr:hypothetical protein [Candidatus Melainabacteria bacterium]
MKQVLSFLVVLNLIWLGATLPAMSAELAKEKVLMVFLFDPECQITCDKVRPAVRELKDQYSKSVSYVEIDSSDAASKVSKELADKNRILWFYNDNLKFVPVVGFFTPAGKCLKYLTGAKSKSVYTSALKKAMATK